MLSLQKMTGFRVVRRSLMVGLVGLGSVLAGGCPTETPEDIVLGEMPVVATDRATAQPESVSSSCPEARESFAALNDATYLVALELQVSNPQNPQQTQAGYVTIGTAFAINNNLLATNGHVVDAVLGQQPFPVSRVLAVQAGTGDVIELLRAVKHPDWTGDPINSPDVGLFTTKETVSTILPLASREEAEAAILGDEIALAGFPGDVEEFIQTTPGVTVPQATSFVGTITAQRSFNRREVVTPDTVDQFQHQAPTSPGMSGSAIVRCGKVIGANNAGTVQIFVSVGDDGELRADRSTAAANNFGIHVKHLHQLVDLFGEDAIVGAELPPPFQGGNQGANNPNPPAGNPVDDNTAPGGDNAAAPGDGNGSGNGGNAAGGDNAGGAGGDSAGGSNTTQLQAGVYAGSVTGQFGHAFAIELLADGSITGVSDWNGSQFTLTGSVQQDGSIGFVDNAVQFGLPMGIYLGQLDANGQVVGTYAENNFDNVLGNWAATLQ